MLYAKIKDKKIQSIIDFLMNYSTAIIITVLFCLLLLVVNDHVREKYSTDIVGYIENSMPLSIEEKAWIERNKIVFGADNNSPPLRYVDLGTGQYKGTTLDIVDAISEELKVPVIVKPYVFKEALINLENGNINMFDMFPSDERSKKYLFTTPIYRLCAIIITNQSNMGIDSYNDLEGLKVSTPEGDYAEEFLREKGINVQWVKKPNMEESMKLLLENKIDCVVGDEPVVVYFKDRMDKENKLKIINTTLYEKEVVFGINKKDETLKRILNKTILQIRKKGTIQRIQQKWFGISVSFDSDTSIWNFLAIVTVTVLFVFLLLFYLMVFWNKNLNREVNNRTEELYNSKNDLQTILDGLAYFMMVADSEGIITNANMAFTHFVKLSREQVIGSNIMDYCDLIFPLKNFQHIWDNVKKGEKTKFEFNNEGSFEVEVFPINNIKNELIKLLFVIKDVTEINMTQRKLIQAEKMVHVGQMAAGIAHEIRNPLGVIKSYVYLLKKQPEMTGEIQEKSIKAIDSSVERATKIIDNLLNYSRMADEEVGMVKLDKFIEDILELQSHLMKNKNIDITVDCRIEGMLTLNKESLRHILINIISNAILAMPNGGKLKILCKKDGDNIVIGVSDTGVGISKKDIENIYYPFFTKREVGEGTGLGLYIAYKEVHKLKGEIVVESEEGKGSTFTIIFPDYRDMKI